MPKQRRGADRDTVQVIIETPQGSRNKYKYHEASGRFGLDNVLPVGTVFPFNFGYVPETHAEDGDPIDVLVLMDEPAFVGCLVKVRLIGVLEATQAEKGGKPVRNDRLIAVAEKSHTHEDVTEVKQINPTLVRQIENFFVAYNTGLGRRFEPLKWEGAKRAGELLEAAAR